MENKAEAVLTALEQVIDSRRSASDETSYTAQLLHGKIDRVLKKVGEEATEVVIAAKGGEKREIINESADLLYHLLVLLAREEIPLTAVTAELSRRFELSGLKEKENRKNEVNNGN